MNEIVIEVNKLRKLYRDFIAVDDVSFNVTRGEISWAFRAEWCRENNHI